MEGIAQQPPRNPYAEAGKGFGYTDPLHEAKARIAHRADTLMGMVMSIPRAANRDYGLSQQDWEGVLAQLTEGVDDLSAAVVTYIDVRSGDEQAGSAGSERADG